MVGVEHAQFVRLRDQVERTIEFVDLVEEHGEVHGVGIRHVVVAFPGAVVLMPLPDVAVERRLAVELELMHVNLARQHLLGWLEDAGMANETPKDLVVRMAGERGPHRLAVLLVPDFVARFIENGGDFALHDRHFLGRKQVRHDDVALVLELTQLVVVQQHDRHSAKAVIIPWYYARVRPSTPPPHRPNRRARFGGRAAPSGTRGCRRDLPASATPPRAAAISIPACRGRRPDAPSLCHRRLRGPIRRSPRRHRRNRQRPMPDHPTASQGRAVRCHHDPRPVVVR